MIVTLPPLGSRGVLSEHRLGFGAATSACANAPLFREDGVASERFNAGAWDRRATGGCRRARFGTSEFMSKPQRSNDQQDFVAKMLASIRDLAFALFFPPKNTVRCVGLPMFRTQMARDVGRLLDIGPSVISWTCLPMVLSRRNRHHIPDFAVTRAIGTNLVDAVPVLGKRTPPELVREAAQVPSHHYETYQEANLRGDIRLDHARDLLQYAAYRVSLGDRVHPHPARGGSLPPSSCLQAVRRGQDAIAVIASLALQRSIEIELDEARIGPDTIISRFRG